MNGIKSHFLPMNSFQLTYSLILNITQMRLKFNIHIPQFKLETLLKINKPIVNNVFVIFFTFTRLYIDVTINY